MQGFQYVDATVKFCRTIDHIFDFFNFKHSFGGYASIVRRK